MHNGGKIITGLVIFLVILLLPIWGNAFSGKHGKPEPKLVTKEKQCVLPKELMRETHMELLNSWRDQVVRQGTRSYQATGGRTVTMSLSGTCMSCHPNKKDFCDSCHNYLAVAPYCWDCHVAPKENA